MSCALRRLSRAEPIMLKKVHVLCYAALLQKSSYYAQQCPYYAQIMLIKCDPHSENQPSGLFQVRLCGVYFHNFSMLADIGPLPSRFDGKTLVDC